MIPDTLLPDEPRARRAIYPALHDNLINNPDGLVKIGDPGFIVGADEDGFIPSVRPGQRHLFSYIVFERFLKHHIYTVVLDRDVFQSGVLPYGRSRTAIEEIIVAGASAYTHILLESDLLFEDEMLYEDDGLDVIPHIPLENTMEALDNQLMIGEKSWTIGDSYEYTGGPPAGIDIGTGKLTDIAVGGIDPAHLTLEISNDESGSNLADIVWTGDAYKLTLQSADKFLEGEDEGRYITTSVDPLFQQVSQVIDARNVLLADGNTGTNLTWSLWKTSPGDPVERIGFIEWPIQLRVI